MPFFVYTGPYWVFACRVVIGIAQVSKDQSIMTYKQSKVFSKMLISTFVTIKAVLCPASYTLIARFCPVQEHSRFTTAVMSGYIVGNALGMVLGGQIIKHFGWQW